MAPALRAGSVAAQAAALGHLSGSERHSAVLSLQQIQGGRHVQRVIAATTMLQRETVPGTVRPPLAPDDPEKLLDDLQAVTTPKLDRSRLFHQLAAAPAKSRKHVLITVFLGTIFASGSTDLLLAETTQIYGPPPFWPQEKLDEFSGDDLAVFDRLAWNLEEPQAVVADRAREEAKGIHKPPPVPVPAFFFAGKTSDRALVIGGVHGDEPSGVEVVNQLREILTRSRVKPQFTVVLIPSLFPANVATGARHSPGKVETNRNFPTPGTSPAAAAKKKSFDGTTGYPLDAMGRRILRENLMLLDLIEKFRPSRIASVHAHPSVQSAGFFAEEHEPTGSSDEAKETAEARSEADRNLVLEMAKKMEKRGQGDTVLGNRLGTAHETGLFPPGPKNRGASFGDYMREAVDEGVYEPEPGDRPSITTVTVEVAGTQTSEQVKEADQAERKLEIKTYAQVLSEIFLGLGPAPRRPRQVVIKTPGR